MRPSAPLTILAALALSATAAGHDLFLELASHRLTPSSPASIALVNGTFGKSDNVITRDRMLDVSIVGPGGEVVHPPATDWRDEGTTSWLDFETGGAGTYLIGVSTAPRVIELSAESFHDYLRHDGVLDVLEERTRDGRLDEAARERYSKHVKAVFQSGDARTGAFDEVLGYPIEIVPLVDPCRLVAGGALPVQVLRDGRPLAGQLVYASHAGHHAHDESGGHVEAFSGRTDEEGRVRIPTDAAGRWYVRLIHMVESPEPDVDYESRWATLTFEVDEQRRASASQIAAALAATIAFGAMVVLLAGRRVGTAAGRGL